MPALHLLQRRLADQHAAFQLDDGDQPLVDPAIQGGQADVPIAPGLVFGHRVGRHRVALLVRAEGVAPWQGTLAAVTGQPLRREVQIVHLRQADLRCPPSVPVRSEQQRPVACAGDSSQQGTQLRLRQNVDSGRVPGVWPHASRDASGKSRGSASSGDSWGTK